MTPMRSAARSLPATDCLLSQETLQLFSHHVADHVADRVHDSLSQRTEVQLRQGPAVRAKGHGAQALDVDLPAHNHRLLGGTSWVAALSLGRGHRARSRPSTARPIRILVMDRGIPTDEMLAEMRQADPPVSYLVG